MPEVITTVYLVLMFIALYFFFFYILLILRNKHRLFYYPKPKRNFSISVLIPAYNEEETIENTVRAVLNSDYKGLKEVIVINDGSKDNTGETVRRLQRQFKKLKLIDKKNSGKGDSLNWGIKKAEGELIAVVDADSYPEKESVRKIAGFFNDEKVGAVTSAVFVRNRDRFLGRLQALEYTILAWTRKLLDFIDAVYVTTGPLSVYRKKYLVEIGGFDPKSVTEDIEVTWHLLSEGYKTKMCLSAFVTTTVPVKIRRWWRQRERWGIGGIDTIFKYKKAFLRKGMLGFFVIPFVSLSILLSMGTFLFGLYLISRKFILTYLSVKYSYFANTYLFALQDINLYPSILIFFTVVLFSTAFFYTRFILRELGERRGEWMEIRNLFNRLFYLLVYLTLYPLVWFSAILRMIRRDYSW